MKQSVLLFLMTKKGFSVINFLINNKLIDQVGLVVIGVDKNQNDFSKEIEKLCVENEIKYCYRSDTFLINNYSHAIAIGWRWMIKEIKKLIIIHDSILPKYRGFAPLVNMLLDKEKKIGATAIWASEKYDEGDIIVQESIEISYPIKIEEAIDLMSNIYISIISKLFAWIEKGNVLPRTPQNNVEATYSLWLDEEDYHIDWSKSADEVLTIINAVGHPYKGAYTLINDRKARILEAEIVEDISIENRHHGKVIFIVNDKPNVVCGKGIIQLNKIFYEDTGQNILPLKTFRTRFK